MSKTRYKMLGTIAVLAHFVVVLLHGRAHEMLGIGLSAWQNIFVVMVIVIAPLIAMILLWTRHARLGLIVLAVSMFGSFLFGVVNHHVIVSPDNTSYLPPGEAQGLFRLTALLSGLTELIGLVIALWALRRRADS